jgi:uncharacterized protein DUF5132
MQEPKLDGNGSLANPAERVATPETEHIDRDSENRSDVVATATVAVVGIVAAAFEAALLPGIVLGVAAVWLPQHFPKMGAALNPLFRTTVRGAYKIRQKTQEMMAEAHEQVQDIVAEVDAEGPLKASKVPVA